MIYTLKGENGEEYVSHVRGGGLPPDPEGFCRFLDWAFAVAFGELPPGESPWARATGTGEEETLQ